MCRWLAYTGNPIHPETVLFRTEHSLIDQSLHSRMGLRPPMAMASVSAGTATPPIFRFVTAAFIPRGAIAICVKPRVR